MRITKYPQSCLLIEKDSKRLLIDPGSFVTQQHSVDDLLPLDAILITHEHPDHADPSLLQSLVDKVKIPVIANESTARVLGPVVTRAIHDKEEFEVAGFKVMAADLPHCLMVDGSEGPQNTGYLIDTTFFTPGDGTDIDSIKAKNAAVPIAGPDISPHDVYHLIKQIGCTTVIPMHYDYFPGDPKFFTQIIGGLDKSIKVVCLNNGESTDLTTG